MVKITAVLALTLTEKVKLSYIRSLNKTLGLKRSLFDLFDFGWFESWGPWLEGTLKTQGIILLVRIRVLSLMCCILSKLLNTCSQSLTTKSH